MHCKIKNSVIEVAKAKRDKEWERTGEAKNPLTTKPEEAEAIIKEFKLIKIY